MAGSGSPCGACKFLRRKCVRGCVFAPYFSHDQGATHFAAIHKVFGASNVSKLLAHLPLTERCEAAITISYEAQARVQDPVYGCVSHIFALQQQVVNLQAQLSYLKEQAAGPSCLNTSTNRNPNEKYFDEKPATNNNCFPQDISSWFHVGNSNHLMGPEFHTNLSNNSYESTTTPLMDINPINIENYYDQNSSEIKEESNSFCSFDDESSNTYDMNPSRREWAFHEVDDLHSLAFGGYNR